MFRFNADVTPTDCEPGVTRKILCYSDELMMCEITFKKGSKEISTTMNICRLLTWQKAASNLQSAGRPRL